MTLANQGQAHFQRPVFMRGRGGIDYEWFPIVDRLHLRTGNNSYNIWVIPADGGAKMSPDLVRSTVSQLGR